MLITLLSLVLLVISLAAVVLLAKTLSYPVDAAIRAAGLPKAFVGVVIALIVLMPEGLAAIKSALRNRLQNSINLALGSAIASIGSDNSDGGAGLDRAQPSNRAWAFRQPT